MSIAKKLLMASAGGGGFPTTQEAKLTPSAGGSNDEYGYEVDLTADGNRAIVGQNKEGYVYVYSRSGSTWSEEAKLQGSDTLSGDAFGLGCAIDSDGDTVAVGAPYDDDNGNSSGAVYIFTRSGTTWTQQAKLTGSGTTTNSYMGYSCSLSDDGNTMATGCLFDTGNTSNSGSIRIFTRSGSTWTEQQKVYISGPSSYGGYGRSCALSGDGNLLVGGSGTGHVGIHSRSGSTWSVDQVISEPSSGIQFGMSCDMATDKSTIIVGAPRAGSTTWQGYGYIYTESGGTWSLEATLSASNAQAYDRLGQGGAALSSDGNVAVIGSPYADNSGGTSVGTAYVYTRSGTTWTEQQLILASDGAAGDGFSWYLDLSQDATTLLATSWLKNGNTGAAYIFV